MDAPSSRPPDGLRRARIRLERLYGGGDGVPRDVEVVLAVAERGLVPLHVRRDPPQDHAARPPEEPGVFPHLAGAYGGAEIPQETKDQIAECKRLVAETRRQRFVLPRKQFLTLRSLVIRQRAKTADPLLSFVIGFPDGVVWNVLSFWRGSRDAKVASLSKYWWVQWDGTESE